jgi:hypothetical protein
MNDSPEAMPRNQQNKVCIFLHGLLLRFRLLYLEFRNVLFSPLQPGALCHLLRVLPESGV